MEAEIKAWALSLSLAPSKWQLRLTLEPEQIDKPPHARSLKKKKKNENEK